MDHVLFWKSEARKNLLMDRGRSSIINTPLANKENQGEKSQAINHFEMC